MTSLEVSLDERSSSRGDSGLELRHCSSKDTLSGLDWSTLASVYKDDNIFGAVAGDKSFILGLNDITNLFFKKLSNKL